MKFEEFISLSEAIRGVDLPGEHAHDDALPGLSNHRRKAQEADKSPKISSVAAIVYPIDGSANVLLTKRQSYEGVHSGQISFPGGKVEESDPSLESAARREVEEEVGIEHSLPELVSVLSEVYIPPSRFLVHPHLFIMDTLPQLHLNEREVHSVIHLPIEVLLDDQYVVQGEVSVASGLKLKTPFFYYEGHKIWGATAMMLNEIKYILKNIES